MERDDFLYPKSKYYGKWTPKNIVFDANLQDFCQRVMYICNLETNGKISSDEAYQEIKSLWKQLKRSKKSLKIGTEETGDSDLQGN